MVEITFMIVHFPLSFMSIWIFVSICGLLLYVKKRVSLLGIFLIELKVNLSWWISCSWNFINVGNIV